MDGELPSKLLEELSNAAGIVRRHDFFRVYSHYDADGLTAASIVATALARQGKEFGIRIFPTLNETNMQEIESADSDCIIVTDLGASYIKRFDGMECDAIILDHHTVGDRASRVCYANPHLYGIDGMSSGCGATMAFLFAVTLSEDNWDLAPVALAGVVGDRQHLNGLTGLNAYLLDGAKKRGLVKERKGSLIPSGNLATELFVCTDPFICGVSGSADGTSKLLEDAGIKSGLDYEDLTPEEVEKLSSMIAVRLIAKGVSSEKLNEAVRTRYFLPSWKTDAETLSDAINACGRNDASGIGIGACMGDEECLRNAVDIDSASKKSVTEAVLAVSENGLHQMKNIQWFDSSDSGFTGIVCGAVMNYIGDPTKPTIGINCSEPLAKISSRGTFSQLDRGIDLADAMTRGCAAVGGEGGGHRIAAGGSVDSSKRDEFLSEVDRLIGEQLRKKSASKL